MYFLDTILTDLKTIMGSVVIKYEKTAKTYETVDTQKAADRFISASNAEDTFHTYQTFDVQAVTNAGVLDITLATAYAGDKTLIPMDMRDRVVLEQRKLLINSYTEENNYYRMLQGLPNMEETVYIYLDASIYTEFNLDPSLAIHQLSEEAIVKLQKKGVIDSLIALYPDKKYLKFLGINKIDLVRARTAKAFSILNLPKDISESFFDEFNNTYEQCREYFMTVIYVKDFSSRYDFYDNFIGMMIMIMTIQRVITNTFKYGIERDFYDLGSIQMLLESYNVPFIVDLPMDYQRLLVRNLNSLLYYKSTDKVLYDVCTLLGFERIEIYKYFLVKEHKLDTNDNPIFMYKEVTNDDGTTSMIEDNTAMYDLFFQTVELRDRNVALALGDAKNRVDYEQVISDDPFWWSDDQDLQTVLYDTEYNYVETKFLRMNIMYKLTDMLFEVSTIFRMLIDNKDKIGQITIQLPKLFDQRDIPLFDAVVFMCALISRKNGFVGNIISTPSQVLDLKGFNFKADFTSIKNNIQTNPKLDKRMLAWILDLDISSAVEINSMYDNIKQLNDFIVDQMAETQDLATYRAYKKLYDAMMVTQHMEALFTKTDGTIATTFLDYLMDIDPVLGLFVDSAETDNITGYIDHVLYKINGLIPDLQNLYILNDSNNVLLNAAITLIRFFKSYTTDLSSFNILYLMDSRYFNMIKLIHNVKLMSKNLEVHDNTLNFAYRSIGKLATTINQRDRLAEVFNKQVNKFTKTIQYKDKTAAVPVMRDRITLIRS